jgi:2,4-dienoyl-CoA reductase (NADPH2)
LAGQGNSLDQTIETAKRLKAPDIDVNYVHVTSGFGFICPNDNPGDFPLEEVVIFCDSTRHLSRKAALRAFFMHTPLKYLAKVGWKRFEPGCKLPDTVAVKNAVGLPVIVNGGFQTRSLIETALQQGCDLVSIGRPLLANPDLIEILRHRPEPANPCTFCNRCDMRTSLFPVGCYDPARFGGDFEAMEQQIIRMSGNPVWPHPRECDPNVCVGSAPHAPV